MPDVATHYLEEARRQFRGHERMGERAMEQLRDEDFLVTLDGTPSTAKIAHCAQHTGQVVFLASICDRESGKQE